MAATNFARIKPGAYPHRDTPAHIHAHLYGPRYSERSIEDYWFKGDPRITSAALDRMKELGEEPVIVALERGKDGVWRGVRDVKLKPAPR